MVCRYPGCHTEYHLYSSFNRHWNKLRAGHQNISIIPIDQPAIINSNGNWFIFLAKCSRTLVWWLYIQFLGNNIDEAITNSETIADSLLSQPASNQDLGLTTNITDGPFELQEVLVEHSAFQARIPHREISTEVIIKNPAGNFGELERWEAGILLLLRQRYYLPFDALLQISSAIHEHYEMKLALIQVVIFCMWYYGCIKASYIILKLVLFLGSC